MKNTTLFHRLILVIGATFLFTACNQNKYVSDSFNGRKSRLNLKKFNKHTQGPNMTFVEGNNMFGDSVMVDVFVASFYMDETEVSNKDWLEYLQHLQADSSEEHYQKALPDTTVWRTELAFNDPYIDHYLRYSGFRLFPVVGISWKQANDYTVWRTAMFHSKNEHPSNTSLHYRLPSEAEWEYAASAFSGTSYFDKKRNQPLANFKNNRPNEEALNEKSMITEYIYAYPPNDYGLYNMAGNVNEWVYDRYNDETKPNTPTRIYKGGSWKDVVQWLTPSSRRYLEEDSAASSIGFRCVMVRSETKH